MKLILSCGVLLLVACWVGMSAATYYSVGGDDGWGPGNDYAAWAKNKTFRRGDVLVFTYDEGYGVEEVVASDMKRCNGSKPLYQGIDGNTSIPLTTVGPHFFICSQFHMCSAGMNMTIIVTPS